MCSLEIDRTFNLCHVDSGKALGVRMRLTCHKVPIYRVGLVELLGSGSSILSNGNATEYQR